MNKQKKRSIMRGRDSLQFSMFLACIVCLMFRIPLFSISGVKTVAYYSYFYELYVILGCVISFGLTSSVSSLVRYRIKRDQIRNVERVVTSGLFFSLLLTCILGAIIFFPLRLFAENILQLRLTLYLSLVLMITILFRLFVGILRGYFEGSGARIPSVHGYLIEAVVYISASIIGASIFQGYGDKIAALLRVVDFSYAYIALGASIGALFASIIEFLYLLFIYAIFKRGYKNSQFDQTKVREGMFQLLPMLMLPALPVIARIFLVRLVPFIDGIFLLLVRREGVDPMNLLGNYYTKILVIVEVFCYLYFISADKFVRRIIYFLDRDEYRVAKEKTINMLKHIVLITFPTGVLIAVYSSNLLEILFHEKDPLMSVTLAISGLCVIFVVFAAYLLHLLNRLGRTGQVFICLLSSFFVHLICLIFVTGKFANILMGVAVTGVISFAVLCVLSGIFVFKNMQLKVDLLHLFAFPMICASVSGLLSMLFNNVLVNATGDRIAFCIGLPFAFIVYITLLLALHSVNEEELRDLPLGKIVIWYGNLTRLL